MNLTLAFGGGFPSLEAVVTDHERDGDNERTQTGTEGRHTCPDAEGCIITEHGTKPSVGRPCSEGRHTEHKLSADDAHGKPNATLLVSSKEDTGGDEANQTSEGRKTVHRLRRNGIIDDITRDRINRFEEEAQKTKPLESAPDDEKDTHHLGSAGRRLEVDQLTRRHLCGPREHRSLIHWSKALIDADRWWSRCTTHLTFRLVFGEIFPGSVAFHKAPWKRAS